MRRTTLDIGNTIIDCGYQSSFVHWVGEPRVDQWVCGKSRINTDTASRSDTFGPIQCFSYTRTMMIQKAYKYSVMVNIWLYVVIKRLYRATK